MDEVVADGKCMGKGMMRKRERWEIEDDLRAIQRTKEILTNKERLVEVQELAKEKQEEQKTNNFIVEGDLQSALGL